VIDRLCAVGYVGGKHLVSVDVENYIFALYFKDTTACASIGATCGNGFKCGLQRDLV